MRTLLTAVSAIAVAVSVPTLAADISVPVQFPEEYFESNKAAGYIDLHYGFYRDDLGIMGDANPDWRLAGIYGRANLPFSPASPFNLQLDGTADALYVQDGISFATPTEATAHLYVRDPSRFALGAFGSYGVIDGRNMWGGGVEGQLYLGGITLYGQGGYRWVDVPGDAVDQWYGRAIARYFPTDNIRIEGEIGYASYNFQGLDVEVLSWLATAEYRFDHMPLGIYAQYRGNSVCCNDNDYDAYAVLFGLRAHLGNDSLLDNDRRGASFDTQVLHFLLRNPIRDILPF